MKKNKLFWILTVVCVLNFAAHLYFYPSLPDIVPTHWGAGGQVNGWGPKSTVLILAVLPFAMLILFEVIRKIDPKHQNFEKFGKVWNLCVVLFTVMMAAFSWLSELAVFGKLPDSSNLVSILVCGGIGVLFIIMGNFMPQIKQNYTFGCRTPWALNDEHNWQRTQRMGGYTFVVMGIVLLVLAFLGYHGAGSTIPFGRQSCLAASPSNTFCYRTMSYGGNTASTSCAVNPRLLPPGKRMRETCASAVAIPGN